MMRIWVVVFCLLMSFPCFAQPMGDKREAIALIEQANEEFEAGEFSSALTKYRKAYRWAPDSRLLYRIGLTYESMGNYQRAREHYELFVLQQPTHEYGPRIKKKITTLRDQEKGQAFLTLDSTPAGATIFVGDEEEAAGMTPSKLPIHPGTHVVRFVMDGYAPIQDEVEVGEGQDVRRSYDLAKGEEVVADEVQDEVQDEVIVAQDIETPAAPAEVFVHQVNFGPPTSVRVLGWTGVVAGFWTTAVGIFFGQYSMAGAGLAALGLGSYGIFIHDWESGLPDVEAQQSPETTTRLQIQMKF